MRATFFESIARREEQPRANEFVFYDGPPFANGLPHYGHLLTGFVKDAVPRYRTMRGERRAPPLRLGHPRPAGRGRGREGARASPGHPEINAYGIGDVQRRLPHQRAAYTEEWEPLRHPPGPLGRLRQRLQDPRPRRTWRASCGRSSRCGTRGCLRGLPGAGVLLALRDAAQQHRDAHGRRLPRPPGPGARRSASSWSTGRGRRPGCWRGRRRPWTLPANLALAVGPDIDYAVVEHDGRARSSSPPTAWRRTRPSSPSTASRRFRWRRCAGRSSSARATAAVRVLHRHRARSAPSAPSRSSAPTSSRPRRAPASSTWPPGSARTTRWRATRSASRRSCRWTSTGATRPRWRRGSASTSSTPTRSSSATSRTPASWFATRPTTTAYPHCWRCAQPLVYRAISSWFVEVTKFRDRMVELNEQITWVPEHLKHGSFGKWLQNARDWSISRNRFWGSPIPVWTQRRPELPAPRRLRLARRAGGRLRRPRHRSPPPVRRRPASGRTPTTRAGAR